MSSNFPVTLFSGLWPWLGELWSIRTDGPCPAPQWPWHGGAAPSRWLLHPGAERPNVLVWRPLQVLFSRPVQRHNAGQRAAVPGLWVCCAWLRDELAQNSEPDAERWPPGERDPGHADGVHGEAQEPDVALPPDGPPVADGDQVAATHAHGGYDSQPAAAQPAEGVLVPDSTSNTALRGGRQRASI